MKTIKKIGFIEQSVYKVNSIFSRQQLNHAKHFLKGIIIDAKASIKRIALLFGEKSHSNLTKFFTKDWWNEEWLNDKRIIEFINKKSSYVLISDDSNKVKFGKKMEGVSFFKKHEDNGFEKAHCVVISGLADEKGEFLPLFSTIYLKEEDAEKYGIPFKSKLEIAREHSAKAKQLGINFFAHIYDSWYFNDDMIKFSANKEYIVSQLSGKFLIRINGQIMKVSAFKKLIDKRKMKVFHSNGKKVRFLEYTTDLSTGKEVKIIPFISEGTTIKVLVSTNLNWSAKRIFGEYSKRQKIEVFIRDCKQELHFLDCHFRDLKPHAKWDAFVMFAYTILRDFLKTKEAITKKIDTIGKAIDYFRMLYYSGESM
jgi:uncharacterized protein YneR